MVTFREARAEDRDAILNLLNRELGENRYFNWSRDKSFWKWKYEQNVFGSQIIFIAESEGKVIGSNTFWPWEFIHRGRTVNAVQSCDTVIDKEYQGKGIFTRLMKKRVLDVHQSKADIIFNFPNQNSVHGYKKLGWHYLSNMIWLVKPLRPVHLLKGLTNDQKADSAEIFGDQQLDAKQCALIYENSLSFNGSIQTKKSEDFFEWRYLQHPFFNYGMCAVQSGRKEAAAIYSVYEKGNHRELVVVDVIGFKRCIRPLFSKITATAKRYGADYVTTVYNPWLMGGDLWRSGYLKVKRKNMVVLPLNPAYETIATQYSNWQVSASMHDAT